MNNQPIFIAITLSLAIFLLIIGIMAVFYDNSIKYTRFGRDNPDEWLLHSFAAKIYDLFLGDSDEEVLAMKLGVNLDEYYRNCAVIEKDANAKELLMNYIYGVVALFSSLFCGLLFNPAFLFIGLFLFVFFTQFILYDVKSKAKARREQISGELPKFLELLAVELGIGLPIDTAIRLLSEKYDCLLSREFLASLNDVKVGASDWQRALENVALKYEVNLLSDFVQDLTIGFEKGVPIAESVRTKAKEVKRKHFLEVKEKAGKAENTILIPIAIFQFIPMFAFILLPTISSVLNFR